MTWLIAGHQLGLQQLDAWSKALTPNNTEQNRGSSAVNIVSGNLVHRQQDELLLSQGIDHSLFRTYNSQGTFDDDNGDQFRFGVNRYLIIKRDLNGQPEAMTRVSGDGRRSVFDRDEQDGRWYSSDGEGAHDTIELMTIEGNAYWVYTEGSSQAQERYSINQARSTEANEVHSIFDERDAEGNFRQFEYNSQGFVNEIVDQFGRTIRINYAGDTATGITVIDGQSLSQTIEYHYDARNRLALVRVDLSPEDSSDNTVFETLYHYDGDSHRVSEIRQGNGVVNRYRYDEVGRIITLEQGEGEARSITWFSYNDGQNTTTITQATDLTARIGSEFVVSYDNKGRVIQQTEAYQVSLPSESLTLNLPIDEVIHEGTVIEYPLHPDGYVRFPGRNRYASWQVDVPEAGKWVLDLQFANGERNDRSLEVWVNGELQHTVLAKTSRKWSDWRPMSIELELEAGPQTIRFTGRNSRVAPHIRDLRLSTGEIPEEISRPESIALESFAYDQDDNLISHTHLDGTQTTYAYENGLMTEKNHAGRITRWHYNEANQLARSTTYRPETGESLSDHFFYDKKKRLRFIVNAEGQIQENRYEDKFRTNSSSQREKTGESFAAITYLDGRYSVNEETRTNDLVDWVATRNNLSNTQRSDTEIDYSSRTTRTRTYSVIKSNGEGDITQTYRETQQFLDEAGNLIQELEVETDNENATVKRSQIFAYDGLNRRVMTQDALGVQESIEYVDKDNKLKTVLANGSVVIMQFDKQGRMVAESHYDSAQLTSENLLAATYLEYDSQGNLRRERDASGAAHHYWYNDQGQMVGIIDSEGAYTELAYDTMGRIINEITYQNKINSSILAQYSLASANFLPPALSPLESDADRKSYFFYNEYGEAYLQVNGAGAVTQTIFNEQGLVVEIREYAQVISLPDSGQLTRADIEAFLAEATHQSAEDRRNFFIYDNAKRLSATVDAENALSLYQYDGANQQIKTIKFATLIEGSIDAFLPIEDFLAAYQPASHADDVHWEGLYDAQGQLVGELDGEGYLSTYQYDAFGNLKQQTRYVDESHRITGTKRLNTSLAYWESLAGDERRQSLFEYNARHELTKQVDEQGVETRYSYTDSGALASESIYRGAQIETTRQYDHDGLERVVKQEDNGSDGISSQTTYTYNQQGQLITETDANGAVTWHLYNTRNELTHRLTWLETTGNDAGVFFAEVQQLSYNAFGELLENRDYTSRLSLESLFANGLALSHPNQLTADNYQTVKNSVLSALASDSMHSQLTTMQYDNRGNLMVMTDAAGYQQRYQYNAFDDVVMSAKQSHQSANAWAVETFSYDGRGQQTQSIRYVEHQAIPDFQLGNPEATNQAIISTNEYNAFGELIESKMGNDQQQRVEAFDYDLNGVLLRHTVDPEGLALFTHYFYNGDGQIVQVNRGGKNQALNRQSGEMELGDSKVLSSHLFFYNENGQLVYEGKITPIQGRLSSAMYAELSNASNSGTDANTNTPKLIERVEYAYNDRNQLVYQKNPSGETFYYQYDSQGRLRYQMREVSRNNADIEVAVTAHTYDEKGQLVHQALYEQSALLNNDQTLNTDSLGEKRRDQYWVYDEAGRVALTIDPMHAVTAYHYDSLGRNTQTTHYADVNSELSQWYQEKVEKGEQVDSSEAKQRAEEKADNGLDRTERVFYNRQNLPVILIDAEGFISQNRYDGFGRITQTHRYSAQANFAVVLSESGLEIDELSTNDILNAVKSLSKSDKDIESLFYFDAAGRLVLAIDGDGYGTYHEYDGLGNLKLRRRIGHQVQRDSLAGNHAEQTTQHDHLVLAEIRFLDAASGLSLDLNSVTDFRDTLYFYDANQRLIQTVDENQAISFTAYNGLSQQLNQTQGVERLASGSEETLEDPIYYRFFDENGRIHYLIDKDNLVMQVEWADDQPIAIHVTSQAIGQADADYYREYHEDIVEYDAYDYLSDVFIPLGNREFDGETIDDVSQIAFYLTGEREQASFDFSEARQSAYVYDDFGNLQQQSTLKQAQEAISVSYQYNEQGQLVTMTDAMGTPTRFFYNTQGQRTHNAKAVTVKEFNADSNATQQLTQYEVTAWDYDSVTGEELAFHRYRQRINLPTIHIATSETIEAKLAELGSENLDNAATISSYKAYNQRGQVQQLTEGNGQETEFTYTAFGELQEKRIKVTTGSDILERLEHDRRGLLTRTSHLQENDTPATYDELEYDAFGRVARRISATGESEAHTYDNRGQVLSTHLVNGAVLSSSYNGYGELTQAWDALGHRTTYSFDIKNRRMTQQFYGVGESVQYTFESHSNAFGETIKVIDRDGFETDYHYDKIGNLVRIIEGPEPGGQGLRITEKSYNNNSQLTRTQTGERATNYYYDDQNRLVEQRETDSNDSSLERITRYRYDGAGQRLVTESPDGSKQWQFFDGSGKVAWMVTQNGARTAYQALSYNELGQVSRLESGEIASTELPNLAEVSSTVMLDAPRQVLAIYEYDYDVAGKRIAERHLNGSTSDSQLISEVRTDYDPSGRVVSTTNAAGAQTHLFYNERGEKEWVVDSLGRVSRFIYNDKGQVQLAIDYAYTAQLDNPNWQAAYQNLIEADRTTAYFYDDRDRLSHEIASEGEITSYQYNQRDEITETTRWSSLSTLFIDLESMSGIEDFVTAAKSLLATTNAQLSGLDASQDDDARIESLYYDALGRVRFKLDEGGYLVSYRYNEFDQIIKRSEYARQFERNQLDDISAVRSAITMSDIQQGRHEYYYYNDLGQRTLVVDAAGQATRFHYSLSNQETGTTRYELALSDVTTTASVDELLSILEQGEQRQERIIFDSVGKERFRLTLFKDAGVQKATVSETRYQLTDRMGSGVSVTWRQVDEITYSQAIAYDEDDTEASLSEKLVDTAKLSRKTTFKDALGQVRETVIFDDPTGELSEQTSLTQLYYDSMGNLTRKEDALGYNEYFQYDSAGQQTGSFKVFAKQIGENEGEVIEKGIWVQNRYNAFGDLVQVSEYINEFAGPDSVPEGPRRVTQYLYNENRKVTAKVILNEQAEVFLSEVFEYDAFGNQTAHITLLEGLTEEAALAIKENYDDQDNGELNEAVYSAVTTSTINAYQQRQLAFKRDSKFYNLRGQLIELKRAEDTLNGQDFVRYTYNAFGEQTRIEHSSGQFTVNEYSAVGQKSKELTGYLTASGEQTVLQSVSTTRNGFGEIIKTEKQGSQAQTQTLVAYNHRGQVQYEVDALGYISHFLYDNKGALRETRRYDEAVNFQALQASALKTTISDYLNESNHAYIAERVIKDGRGRTTETLTIRVNGATAEEKTTSSFIYNGLDQMLSHTDANGKTTVREYDGLGRVIRESVQLQAADADGRDVYHTDYQYNGLGHQLAVSKNGESAHLLQATNVLGQVTESANAMGVTTQWVYDRHGRAIEQHIIPEGGDRSQARSHYYFYNALGHQVAYLNPKGALSLTLVDQAGNTVLRKMYSNTLELDDGQRAQLRTTIAEIEAVNQAFTAESELSRETLPSLISNSELALQSLETALSSLLTMNADEDRKTYAFYDGLNRQTATLRPNAENYTVEGSIQNQHLIETVQYDTWQEGLIAISRDASGAESRQYYNANNQLVLHVLPFYRDSLTPNGAESEAPRAVRYEHDAFGNTIKETKHISAVNLAGETLDAIAYPLREDRTTVFHYDAFQRLTKKTMVKAVFYGINDPITGQPTRDKYVESQIVIDYTYDSDTSNNVARQRTYEEGRETLDANFSLIGEVSVTEYDYDAIGRVIQTRAFEANSLSNLSPQKGKQLKTDFQYDHFDQIRKKTETNNDGQQRTQTYTYDKQQLVTTAGYEGHQQFTYDDFGQQQNVDDQVTGLSTHYRYDQLGQIIEKRYSGEADTTLYTDTYQYNAFSESVSGQRQINTGDEKAISLYLREYDQLGRVVKTEESGVTRWLAYDAQGNLSLELKSANHDDASLSLADWLGNETDKNTNALSIKAQSYNALGQVLNAHQVLASDLNLTSALHHLANASDPNVVTPSSGPEIHTQQYRYNRFGEQARIIDQDGYQTEFLYNAAGQLWQKVLSAVSTLSAEFDDKYRLELSEGEEQSRVQYQHDALGRIIKEIDENGNVETKDWDFSNLVEHRHYTGSPTAPNSFHARVYDYNTFGDVTAAKILVSSGSGHIDTVFDKRFDYQYQVQSHRDDLGIGGKTQVTEYLMGREGDDYAYYQVASKWLDAAGRLRERSQHRNVKSGATLIEDNNLLTLDTFDYDAFSDIKRVVSHQSRADLTADVANANWDLAQYRQETTKEYGVFESIQGAEVWLQSTVETYKGKSTQNGAAIQQRTMTRYDAFDRQLRHIDESDMHNNPNNRRVKEFVYDAKGQLISEVMPAMEEGEFFTVKTYEYNSKGEKIALSVAVDGQLEGGFREEYSYDARGNLIMERSIRDYNTSSETERRKVANYDGRNRLLNIAFYEKSELLSWQMNYGYDAKGNITRQQLEQSTDGNTIVENRYFQFDFKDRVIASQQDGLVQSIVYDAQDRQILIDTNKPGFVPDDKQRVTYNYRTDGKVAMTRLRNNNDIDEYYYVYDDEANRIDVNGQIKNVLATLPGSVIQEELNPDNAIESAVFQENGKLLTTIHTKRKQDNANDFGSVQSMDFYRYDAMGKKSGEKRYEYGSKTSHITTENTYEDQGNMVSSTQEIRTLKQSNDEGDAGNTTIYQDVFTRITTRYEYHNASKGQKSSINIDAWLKTEAGVSTATQQFLDRSTNAVWGGASSVLSYQNLGGDDQISEVNKYQDLGKLDNKEFQDILYNTKLTEAEKNGKSEDEQEALLHTKIMGLISKKYEAQTTLTDTLSYQNSAQGFISQRQLTVATESSRNSNSAFYYFNGKNLGERSNDGVVRLASPQASQFTAAMVNDPRLSNRYRAKDGDTLQSVAAMFYGDPGLWYLIADANGLQAGSTLLSGQALIVPNVVQSSHNNGETFQPYNSGDRLGDINPVLPDMPDVPDAPPPPPPNMCETIVSTLVSVVITVVFAAAMAAITSALAVTLGPVGAVLAGVLIGAAMGAVEGAITSLATQGVQMAFGSRDAGDVNWSDVASGAAGGAVGGAIGGGIGAKVASAARTAKGAAAGIKTGSKAVGSTSRMASFASGAKRLGRNLATGVAMGAASNATSQGVAIATGGQQSFDAINFATAAGSSALNVGVGGVNGFGGVAGNGKLVGNSLKNASTKFATVMTASSAIAMTASVVEHAAYGNSMDSFDWGSAAIRAVGEGLSEAGSDYAEARTRAGANRYHNRRAINHATKANSDLGKVLSHLGNDKANTKALAVLGESEDAGGREFRQKVSQALKDNMSNLEFYKLKQVLESLPNKIRADKAGWQSSLASSDSLPKTAQNLSMAETTEAIDSALSPNCFAAGTLIHTQDGLVPIEKITKRHRVLTRNENDPSAPLQYRPILDHFTNTNKEVVRLTFEYGLQNKEGIVTTPGHLFFVAEKGWVSAIDLCLDDNVYRSGNKVAQLRMVEKLEKKVTVYNFEVPVDHTYFVGNGGFWVHNDKCEKWANHQIAEILRDKGKIKRTKVEVIATSFLKFNKEERTRVIDNLETQKKDLSPGRSSRSKSKSNPQLGAIEQLLSITREAMTNEVVSNGAAGTLGFTAEALSGKVKIEWISPADAVLHVRDILLGERGNTYRENIKKGDLETARTAAVEMLIRLDFPHQVKGEMHGLGAGLDVIAGSWIDGKRQIPDYGAVVGKLESTILAMTNGKPKHLHARAVRLVNYYAGFDPVDDSPLKLQEGDWLNEKENLVLGPIIREFAAIQLAERGRELRRLEDNPDATDKNLVVKALERTLSEGFRAVYVNSGGAIFAQKGGQRLLRAEYSAAAVAKGSPAKVAVGALGGSSSAGGSTSSNVGNSGGSLTAHPSPMESPRLTLSNPKPAHRSQTEKSSNAGTDEQSSKGTTTTTTPKQGRGSGKSRRNRVTRDMRAHPYR